MSIKKTACLVLLFSLLCMFWFPSVQGVYLWQIGRKMSRSYSGWDTSFNSAFTWKCSGNSKSIWNIQSVHEYYHEDRVWKFNCQSDYTITSSCSWSGRVNTLDGTFSYKCPDNGHIVGMDASTFNGPYKDREFNFKCCGTASRTNCRWTSYVNDWDGDMDYNVPNGYYLAGVSSHHDNNYEDRRWKFYICQ